MNYSQPMTPQQAVTEAVRAVELALGVKTVGQIVARYGDALTNTVYETLNRRADAIDQRRLHKAFMREFAPQVFLEGMREGGITEPDDEDMAEMEESVSDWLSTQLPHVNGFAADTQAARDDTDQRGAIIKRITLWVNAMRELGAQGRAYAHNNRKGIWILGPTEHCRDCMRYSRLGPHRMSYWRKRKLPRDPDLECHGYNCKCNIIDPNTGESLL